MIRCSLRSPLALDAALAALNAAAEETRLRLLALLAESELTVSEVVAILGQSQPRVSRHLKLLVEAGVVERRREGAWAFFRLAPSGPAGGLARSFSIRSTPHDPMLAGDRARLAEMRAARAENAARYFADHADEWDDIRARHIPEARVEEAIREAVGDAPIRRLLDLGAGAGRMLELFAPRAEEAIGVDLSSAMLAVGARATRGKRRAQCAAAPGRHLRAAGRPATPAISRSCIRCCIISTIPAAPCARRRGCSRRADD